MPCLSFVARWRERFLRWWRAPITLADRLRGAFVGAFGGLWLGLFAALILGSMPMPGAVILGWVAGGAVTGLVFGLAFPKVATVVLFPFATFGSGS